MRTLASFRRKVLALTAAVVATCFSHGSCYDDTSRFFDDTFGYGGGWYEETFYYDDYYYYDDRYYYDDCGHCGGGWDSWFDWF